MYCIYLRKSRADLEAESHGEGETLKRHQDILLALAKKMNISITKIYSEIVSGETIASRPEMQNLLNDVESGMWEGVLVVEVERLARGDTMDQGLVSHTFKVSGTKIITPVKIYDPNNEFDEEYFEFGLFMSRREYKTINRRLQRGRAQSINEGKYVGNIAPYGYTREKIKGDKGYKLAVIPEEAAAVKIIYDLYVNKKMGNALIAKELDKLNIKPRKNEFWSDQTIRGILSNPVYIGKIRWGARATQKKSINGSIHKSRPRSGEYQLVDGLHEAIITEDVFNQAQAIRHSKIITTANAKRPIANPLASLIVCEKCGRKMVMRKHKNSRGSLMCQNPHCKNVSSPVEEVETKLIKSLELWLEKYKLDIKETSTVDLTGKKKNALNEYLYPV
jgi:DNA invertase Pin-like site-specific DNA recombinase